MARCCHGLRVWRTLVFLLPPGQTHAQPSTSWQWAFDQSNTDSKPLLCTGNDAHSRCVTLISDTSVFFFQSKHQIHLHTHIRNPNPYSSSNRTRTRTQLIYLRAPRTQTHHMGSAQPTSFDRLRPMQLSHSVFKFNEPKIDSTRRLGSLSLLPSGRGGQVQAQSFSFLTYIAWFGKRWDGEGS